MDRRIVGCLCYLVAGFPVGCALNQRGNKKNKPRRSTTHKASKRTFVATFEAGSQAKCRRNHKRDLLACALYRSLSVLRRHQCPNVAHTHKYTCMCVCVRCMLAGQTVTQSYRATKLGTSDRYVSLMMIK